MKHKLLLALSLCLLALSISLYVDIQLVSKGPYGTAPFLFCLARSPDYWTYGGTVAPNSCRFLNNDQALEIAGFASFFGFFAWNYRVDTRPGRIRREVGRTLFAYSSIIGSIVIVTNFILWKVPGYDWVSNPMGLPWWSEQVTYQTCLIKQADFSSAHPNCVFLNYGEVFEICVLLFIVGWVLMYSAPSEPEGKEAVTSD